MASPVLSTLVVLGALACSKATPAASEAPPAAEAPSPSTPAPETPTAAEGKDRCKVLDMAMLRETLGAPALELASEDGERRVLQCRYVTPGGRPSALIQITREATRKYFDDVHEAAFKDAKPVDGLGDAAYSRNGKMNVLVALKGDRQIQLISSFDADRSRTLMEKLIATRPF